MECDSYMIYKILSKQKANGTNTYDESNAIILQLSDSSWNLDDVKSSTTTELSSFIVIDVVNNVQ